MATPLTYDLPIVLILFIEETDNATPTHEQISQFDADLQSVFDLMLQQILTQEGLPVEQHTKSLVLGCRPHMIGNTPQLQIRNACRYVKAAHQAMAAAMDLVLTAPGGPGAARAVAVVPTTRRKKRTKRGRPRGN